MIRLLALRRTFPPSSMGRAWAAAVVSIVALAVAASVGEEAAVPAKPPPQGQPPDDAPAGYDTATNGYVTAAEFAKALAKFEEVEGLDDGLGPVYNATSCTACHQNPVTGGSSQVAELRAGRNVPDPHNPSPHKVQFQEPPGGSVIQQRAIDAAIQERVRPEDDTRTLRMSNTVLGNGYVEVLSDREILKVRRGQRRWGMEGYAVVVPVAVEAQKGADGKPGFVLVERIGRYGWKCQEASLLNFSAGAYLNEMGVTSPLQPEENTSDGRDVSKYDKVPDPEDAVVDTADPAKTEHPFGVDVESFTAFMRATKVPPRDPALVGDPDVIEGEKLFRNNDALGCAVCHHPDFTTPPAGTPIETLGGRRGSDMATVADALGNKRIHPFSDFLLHDVGTGDGVAQTQHADLPPRGRAGLEKIPDDVKDREGVGRIEASPGRGHGRVLSPDAALDQRTANMMRTAPLWGLRVRPQLMHDGLSFTVEDAILRHHGQAEGVTLKYRALSAAQKKQLLAFLSSL